MFLNVVLIVYSLLLAYCLNTGFIVLSIILMVWGGWGQDDWANLNKMICVMEVVEKNSNKKYEQLQIDIPQSESVSRLLNEFEDRARQGLNRVCL